MKVRGYKEHDKGEVVISKAYKEHIKGEAANVKAYKGYVKGEVAKVKAYKELVKGTFNDTRNKTLLRLLNKRLVKKNK